MRVHVRAWMSDTGDFPPLVVLHGMDESSRAFMPLASRFARDRDVYSVALHGHGESI
jgi:pimeloyl-ACP methyl ester carboxylesterase